MFWANLKAQIFAALRKYLFAGAIKSFIVNQVIKLAAGSLGGFPLMVVTYIAKKLVAWGWAEMKHFAIFKDVEAREELKKEKYETVINNPNSTAEQVAQAGDDLVAGDFK